MWANDFNFWGVNESFEKLKNKQTDREYSEEKQKQDELLEWQFNLLDEVINLKTKLSTLVEPNEATQIQSRLFTKYKSNVKEFDFPAAMQEVFFWEKIWAYKSSGVILEKDNKQEVVDTLFSQEEMRWIKELDSMWKNKWDILKESAQKDILETLIPESTKNIVSETSSSVKNVMNSKETNKTSSFDWLKDSPNYPLLKGLRDSGQLDSKIFSQTLGKLSNAKQSDEKIIITQAIEKVASKDIQAETLSFINGNKKISQNSFSHSKLSQNSQWLWISFDKVWELEVMMANNYLNIPNIHNQNNKKDDFERSIDITLNDIIKWNDKNFKKEHNNIITEIRWSHNLEYKYSQLQKLYKKDLLNDAKYFRRWDKQLLLSKKKEVIKDFNDRKKELLVQWNKNISKDKKLLALKKQHKEIIQDLESLWGEIIVWWKLDTQKKWKIEANETS